MAGILDQLEAQDTSEQNALLERAVHDRSWANTFVSTPPAEVLRANQNYEDLLATAADRKRQLIQTQGPVKDQLTLAQIEHQNAMTSRENFKAIEDQRLSRQADDLYAGLADLKTRHEPNSPEYQSGLLDLIHKNHEAARRDPGIQEELRMTAQSMSDKSYWTRFNQMHKEASIVAARRGVDVQWRDGEPSIEATNDYADSLRKEDGKTRATSDAMRDLAKLNTQLADKNSYFKTETQPKAKDDLQKSIRSIESQIRAWHETYENAPPVAKHLGKYNPTTGNFE